METHLSEILEILLVKKLSYSMSILPEYLNLVEQILRFWQIWLNIVKNTLYLKDAKFANCAMFVVAMVTHLIILMIYDVLIALGYTYTLHSTRNEIFPKYSLYTRRM